MNTVHNQVCEIAFRSSEGHADPFNSVELDVVFTDDAGHEWKVPAFWAGGNAWRVRFAPPAPGRYPWQSTCSDPSDTGLHGRSGELEAAAYGGDSPLHGHGPIKVSDDGCRFEHADGTPFFWLGDTWWMGLCKRWSWPDDFQLMTRDRVDKGFSVIQIVAGLYPDMPAFDERGANEAGFPWEQDFARINPAYFDMADRRIQCLVDAGLMPCIVGCWAYFLAWMGMEKMLKHWRYLVARWGAYPVAWCLAGECAMPYYLSEDIEGDLKLQREGWTDIGWAMQAIDPYRRPITIHPAGASMTGRDDVTDDAVLDFDMLHTGHGGYRDMPRTLTKVDRSLTRKPRKPALVAEFSYEGILHGTQDEIQRLAFWSTVLSGTAGYTYGANGIWQINTREKAYGPSPHGANWGTTPWEDAYLLPGSQQLGAAANILRRYEWWRFEPHPEWVKNAGAPGNPDGSFAAGIPGEVRVIYTYLIFVPITVSRIEADVRYRARYVDPRSGTDLPLGDVQSNADGDWTPPHPPEATDWLLIMERNP